MLTSPEQKLIDKLNAALEEREKTLKDNLAHDIVSDFPAMRMHQGMILGMELVRETLIPEVVKEIEKQRN